MTNIAQTPNPLSQWYRQPKIFVSLPSKGEFYPEGTLDRSEDNTYPVYSMSAKDELMFKTPDALLSGHATVEMIKSCFPAVVDPWEMPAIDVDFAIVAIRIATYGDTMDVDCVCPVCSNEDTFEVNLTNYLSNFSQFNYNPTVNLGELTFKVRPYNYRESTKNTIKTLEHQKIFSIINNDQVSDEEKLSAVSDSFVKIVDLTVDVVANCVNEVITPTGSTTNQAHIDEFIKKADKEVFESIKNHVTQLKEQIDFKAQNVKCSKCEAEYSVPITFDQSDFFGVRS
jgi:hypothetical protein